MRTTVDIPDKLFRKVKATAALRGKKIKDLVEEGLLLALEAPAPKAGGKGRPQTAYDLMKGSIGIVDSGVPDFASNPEHLEGLGRDSMGRR